MGHVAEEEIVTEQTIEELVASLPGRETPPEYSEPNAPDARELMVRWIQAGRRGWHNIPVDVLDALGNQEYGKRLCGYVRERLAKMLPKESADQ